VFVECVAKRSCRSVVGIAVVEQVFGAAFTGYFFSRFPDPNDICCGQHALSDSMSCFACVKSLRDAIWSISPFSNFFRTTYTAHLYVGDFEQNTVPLQSYPRTMLRC
jgi:hypothetical protein